MINDTLTCNVCGKKESSLAASMLGWGITKDNRTLCSDHLELYHKGNGWVRPQLERMIEALTPLPEFDRTRELLQKALESTAG